MLNELKASDIKVLGESWLMRTKIKMFCNLPALLRAHVYKLQPPYLAVNLNSSCPEGLMTGESVYCSKLPLKEESRKSCSMSGGSQRSQQLFPLHSPIGSVILLNFSLTHIFFSSAMYGLLFAQYLLFHLFTFFPSHAQQAGSLKMNTALEYSTRVVQEGERRCKKSTINDLVHLTPLRIPLMNPPNSFSHLCWNFETIYGG